MSALINGWHNTKSPKSQAPTGTFTSYEQRAAEEGGEVRYGLDKELAQKAAAKYDGALEAFQAAVGIDPNHYPALNGVGVCMLNRYLLSGQTDAEARRAAIEALPSHRTPPPSLSSEGAPPLST